MIYGPGEMVNDELLVNYGKTQSSLTNDELADEESAIDDEAVDNLFADFDETLLDDLLAV